MTNTDDPRSRDVLAELRSVISVAIRFELLRLPEVAKSWADPRAQDAVRAITQDLAKLGLAASWGEDVTCEVADLRAEALNWEWAEAANTRRGILETVKRIAASVGGALGKALLAVAVGALSA